MEQLFHNIRNFCFIAMKQMRSAVLIQIQLLSICFFVIFALS